MQPDSVAEPRLVPVRSVKRQHLGLFYRLSPAVAPSVKQFWKSKSSFRGARASGIRGLVWLAILGMVLFASSPALAVQPSGAYVDMDSAFLWGIGSTHDWNSRCPQVSAPTPPISWNPGCSAAAPLGFAVEGRLGLLFRNVGLEAFLLGAADWSSATLQGEPPIPIPAYARDMQIGRVGGGPGIGIRYLTKEKGVRFTAGLGGGLFARFVYTNMTSLDGSSDAYLAPMMRVDMSLILTKFFNLGVLGWAEFSGDVAVKPDVADLGAAAGIPNLELSGLERVVVFSGTQYFIGPYLGLHFGK